MDIRLQTPHQALQTDFDAAALFSRQEVALEKVSEHIANGFITGGMGFLLADGFHEVVDSPVYCRLPGAPDWLLGMTNIRGDIVPMVDLARLLGMAIQSESRQQSERFILIDAQPSKFALRVRDVTGRRKYFADQRLHSPPLAPILRANTRRVYFQEELMWVDIDLPVLLQQAAQQFSGQPRADYQGVAAI